MKILVTSGGTKVPIDGVRDITNMSHGTFGSRIAKAFLTLGHEVTYFAAQDAVDPLELRIDFNGVEHNEIRKPIADQIEGFQYWALKVSPRFHRFNFRNYDDYARELCNFCTQTKWTQGKPDIVVLAAAVSDYVVANPVGGKARSSDAMTIQLTPAEKLINKVKEWLPETKLVGFKLLVNSTEAELFDAANKSIVTNHCDMVVANDLRDIKNNAHRLLLVWPQGLRPRLPKHFTADPKNPAAWN